MKQFRGLIQSKIQNPKSKIAYSCTSILFLVIQPWSASVGLLFGRLYSIISTSIHSSLLFIVLVVMILTREPFATNCMAGLSVPGPVRKFVLLVRIPSGLPNGFCIFGRILPLRR